MSERLHFVTGIDQAAAGFVADALGMPVDDFDPYVAAAVCIGHNMVAGVVFHNYKPCEYGSTIEASIASNTPKWASRRILREMFSYPFRALECTRLQVTCARSNHQARQFNKRLGFTFEGVARRAWNGKEDAFLFSMQPHECRWIK